MNKWLTIILVVVILTASLSSCTRAGGEFTGREFIPDMAHSVAYESNVYWDYTLNTWDKESVIKRKVLSEPRKPIKGTIPRGYANSDNSAAQYDGSFNVNAIYIPQNGSVPYHYVDTEESRLEASAAITSNPFPITNSGLVRGKDLYVTFCAICHGEKGDGNGYLLREDGGVYPAQPAILISDEFISASEGRFYHSIMYGKNVMGSYKDKLSYEERWQVIHYIRSLQAAEKKLAYDENQNTLSSAPKPQPVDTSTTTQLTQQN